jgi:hypothetical protein
MGYPAVYGPLYAGPAPLSGPGLTVPPGVTWAAGNGAAVTTLAPYAPDPLGPPDITPWYVPYSGFIERLPQQWDDMLRGYCQASVTDAWFGANYNPQPILVTEILNDQPYAYWPCTDPATSRVASNLAPGNILPLAQTLSKYGTGGASAAFGQNGSALLGATSTLVVSGSFQLSNQAGMWGLSGLELNSAFYSGYSLSVTDTGFPPVAGGVTVEAWFQFTAPFGTIVNPVILAVASSAGGLFEIVADAISGTGNLQLFTGGHTTGPAISAVNYLAGTPPLTHVAVSFTQSAWTAYVNGTATASGSWSLPPDFSFLSANGIFSSPVLPAFAPVTTPQQNYNGYTAHIAVFGRVLPQARILTHYLAGSTAMQGEPASWRIERLLQAGNCTGRRLIGQEPAPDQDFVVSCQDIPGQPASQSVANITADLLPGMFLIAPTGDMFLLSKASAWDQPVTWTLGEAVDAGEIPYTGGITYDYDPTRIQDQIQLTQLDNQDIIIPSVPAVEAAAQLQYSTISNLSTGYLAGDATVPLNYGPGLYDLANWLANTYNAPSLRLSPVTVDASRYPAAWPFVLGASPGDMVTVNRRPQSYGAPAITVTGRITQVERAFQFAAEGVTGTITCLVDPAPEEHALTLDDPVRGLTGDGNVLGW